MSKYIYGSLIEYEEEWDRWQFTGSGHKRTVCRDFELIEVLNKLGEHGWELAMYDDKRKEYILKMKVE